MGSPYRLDGRTLEGGGQLIRLALGLSALKGRSLEVSHIRGQRSGGEGLKAQHLACVKWLAEACGAETENANIRSRELNFTPTLSFAAVPGNYKEKRCTDGTDVFETAIHIGSPGSVALALQAVLPFILFRPPTTKQSTEARPVVKLTITGGTNVSNSPSYEYLEQVFLPTLSLIGLPNITSRLEKRGWSTGHSTIGSVTFTIPTLRPGEKFSSAGFGLLEGLCESERRPSRIEATVIAPGFLHDIFERCLHAALTRQVGYAKKIRMKFEDSQHNKRIYLMLVAKVRHNGEEVRFGSDELFQRKQNGKFEDMVGEMTARVVSQLVADVESGACIDGHMADQLVVFQALAEGCSAVSRGVSGSQSLHAETAEFVSGDLLGGTLDRGKVQGVGFVAGSGIG